MLEAVSALVTQWRTEAKLLERRGAVSQAAVLLSCAQELEVGIRQLDDEVLTLTAAARETGFSREHLGRLVRNGTIPNAGRPNAPRIRRGDLPRKPGHLPSRHPELHIGQTSTRQIVRSIVEHGR